MLKRRQTARSTAGGKVKRRDKPGTLGDLLYADRSRPRVAEQEWADLVRAIAGRDASALRRLYERSHRLVFSLTMRISGNRESAEELTIDVFHDVWRRAPDYDPANGTVLGWILNQARSRALDRLRHDRRRKRVNPFPGEPAAETEPDGHDEEIDRELLARRLRDAIGILTSDERAAIEAAFFSELTYAEVAKRLGQPLGTIKTRIRSGLGKLRVSIAPDKDES